MKTRKPIIVGNWKLNKTTAEAVELARAGVPCQPECTTTCPPGPVSTQAPLAGPPSQRPAGWSGAPAAAAAARMFATLNGPTSGDSTGCSTSSGPHRHGATWARTRASPRTACAATGRLSG